MALYFDFVNGNDANPGTEASPKKDAGVATLAGQTAIFFRGDQTHYPSARLIVPNGLATIATYGGNSRAILNPAQTTEQKQVISANGRSDFTIRDLQFTNPIVDNTSCISVFNGSTLCSNVVARNLHFFDCPQAVGLSIGAPAAAWTSAAGKATGIKVQYCSVYNMASHGLSVQAAVDGYIIEHCTADLTGTDRDTVGFGAWGIYTQGLWEKHEEAAWTQVDVPNNVWEITQSDTYVIRDVLVPQWWNVSGLVQGWLTAGTYDALAEGEWGSPGDNSSVQVRFAAGGDPTTFDVHVIHEWASNGIMRYNTSSRCMSASETGGDGNGFGGDLGTENLTLHDNESYNNSGSGYSFNQSATGTVYNNKSYGNGWYGFRCNGGKTNVTYYNNAAVNNAEAAFRNQTSGAPFTYTLRNNVAHGGKYSVDFATASTTTIDTITENNNVFSGATTETIRGDRFTPDASDIQAAAVVGDDGSTTPASAGYRQGAFIAGFHDTYPGPWDGGGALPVGARWMAALVSTAAQWLLTPYRR